MLTKRTKNHIMWLWSHGHLTEDRIKYLDEVCPGWREEVNEE